MRQFRSLRDDRPDGCARGQVAIGTLVVFIAMVLIAAMTVGVLFNTAGLLEGQTQETSSETATQLSERLEIVAVTGSNVSSNEDGVREIHQVEVVVSDATGDSNIDLRNVTVQWVGTGGTYSLLNENATDDPTRPTYETVVYSNAGGTYPVLSDSDDRFALRFEPGVTFGESGIPEGGRVDLRISTQSGGSPAIVRIRAPQSLRGTSSLSL